LSPGPAADEVAQPSDREAANPIIAITGLTVTYPGGRRPALDGIDLEVRAGDFVGIMGLNGAGKTTLGLCLNGVIPQLIPAVVAGTIRVAGHDPREEAVRSVARTVGILFDNPEFQLSQPTVADEIALGLENLGVDPGEMPERISESLELVGLSGIEDRSPFALSGGQQQRLACAAVLAMHPNVLFLDEPTSNLDPVGKAELLAVADRLHRERGMTVLIAEHETEALAEHADRIVVLDAGRVVMDGAPAAVLSRVEELAALGLGAPQVAAFAHALRPDATDVPITVPTAVAWLETP
jgi:energy-coupling factor transporter ATP-binding protein EcfA2